MRALVLSGGGAQGAYELGGLNWLLGNLGIEYDILTGVSVGALSNAILSMFPVGEEQDALDQLNALWGGINSDDDIFKEHCPFGRIHAIWRNSVVNSSPLQKLVEKHFNEEKSKASGKKFIAGAVSLTTGKYVEFDQNSPFLTKAIQASSAYPVFFKPLEFDNQLWADGGVKEIVPVKAAVDAGATHIDIITPSAADSSSWKRDDPNALDIAFRVLNLTFEEITDNDITCCIPKDGSITHKIMRPKKSLPYSSLSFDSESRIKMEDLGFQDAQKVWPDASL